MWGGFLIASIAVLAGCARRPHHGDAGPASGPGPREVDAGRKLVPPAPLAAGEHRAVAQPCAPHAGPAPAPEAHGCQHDADCKGPGPAPRCVHALGRNRGHNVCVSDDCQADADCGTGVCQCGGPSPIGNHCLNGNCRIDADCASGTCSPSTSVSPQGACGDPRADVVGYFCHTPGDTCHAAADCAAAPGTSCTFVGALGRWQCMANQQCPDG